MLPRTCREGHWQWPGILLWHVTHSSWLLEDSFSSENWLGNVPFSWHEVSRSLELETKDESVTAERGCSSGTGKCLEGFSGTWLAVLSTWGTGKSPLSPSNWESENRTNRTRIKHVGFSRFSARGNPLLGLVVFFGVFQSILDTWGSWIDPKWLGFQKFASDTLNYFPCFDGFAGQKIRFGGLIWINTQPIN